MNIDELTIGEAREIAALLGNKDTGQPRVQKYPVEVGKAYCFRGVTYHWVGLVKRVVGSYAVLETAAWVADEGRFSEFIANGVVRECEAITVDAAVNMDACMDIVAWEGELITETK